jgi:hypothetical protein
MLDAGRAPEVIAGLTVFFDHADDSLRYVLAQSPRLVSDPDPRLSLVVFRGEAGGSLLQLEATLAPSERALTELAKALGATGKPPTLVRPDWRSGVVHLAGWLKTEALAPRSLFVGSPMLVGDPVAIVAARLDQAGTALASAALAGNSLPTVVIFELETLGLAGPLGVEVEADLRAVHDRLTLEGALTTPYGRARLAKTWESLMRENVIRVHVVDESGEIEGKRAEAMRRVGDDLVARMFSPFPPAERPSQLDDGTVAPLELSFRLTKRREELSTSSRWSFRERRAVPLRHYAAANLIDLLGDRPAARHIVFVDLEATRHEIVVRAEPELARLGITALEVDLRERPGVAVERTVTLTDAAPEARHVASGPLAPLQYRVRARFDPTRTRARDRESTWLECVGSVVVASARRLFPPRSFTVIIGRVEFDWLDHVEVEVQAEGEPAQSIVLSSDRRSARVFLPGAGPAPLGVTVHWRGRAGEPTRSDRPRTLSGDASGDIPDAASDDVLVLDSPFADSINLLVVPLPIAGVSGLVVEVRHDAGGLAQTRTLSWDAPDRAPRRVGLRRLVGSARSYAYRWELMRDDGTVSRRPWSDATSTTLIVGADGPTDVRTAEVALLGGGPAGRGSLAVELVLEAGQARASELLEGDRDAAMLVLVVPRDSPPPVLIAREFLATGAVRETRWTDPESLTVLPPVQPTSL